MNKNNRDLSFRTIIFSVIILFGFECAYCDELPMAPFVNKQLPTDGFNYLTDEASRECVEKDSVQWAKTKSINGRSLFAKQCFESGSGHWVTVAIGIGEPSNSHPDGGIVTNATTIGLKTLGSYGGLPLPWVYDSLDVVIWNSFGDSVNEYTNGSFGLVPWAYRLRSSKLELDSGVTCRLIGSVVHIYRQKAELRQSESKAKSRKLLGTNSNDLIARILVKLMKVENELCKGEYRK